MMKHTKKKRLVTWQMALAGLLTTASLSGQVEVPSEAKNSQTPPPAPPIIAESDVFTGKVCVHCAALRATPTGQSLPVFECERALLVRVTGSDGEFYQITPPDGLKAYIARKFIVDGRVHGQHVNLRARPNTESAILGQVNDQEKVETKPLAKAPDWLEIPYPADRKLYIRKDLVTRVGDATAYSALQSQQSQIAENLKTAHAMVLQAREQFQQKVPEPTSWDKIQNAYEKALKLALSSPAFTEIAHDIVQEQQVAFCDYQKWFLESKSPPQPQEIDQSKENQEVKSSSKPLAALSTAPTRWTRVEQMRLEQWLDAHPEKTESHYWHEQEQQSQRLEGTLAPYVRSDLRQKPGDFLLYNSDIPIAYLYSAQLKLADLEGKACKLRVVKRDDLGFALPAYCVIAVES